MDERARVRRGLAALLVPAAIAAACQTPTVPEAAGSDAPRPDGPSYTLALIGPQRDGFAQVTGRQTTWDPGIGVITLGPEEGTSGPLVQLIMKITGGYEPGEAFIVNATLSTTDRREGTGEQLSPFLFGGQPTAVADGGGYICGDSTMLVESVGLDYIQGSICFILPGLEPDDVPDTVLVKGPFAAFDP